MESLFPDTEKRMFQALPFPEDINITSINPRLVGAGSSYTLSVSMTIDWQNPLTEMTITDYEIRFTTDNSTLCAFDSFNDHSEERMITANNMTQFNTSISEQISVASPQLFVQVYQSSYCSRGPSICTITSAFIHKTVHSYSLISDSTMLIVAEKCSQL